MPPTKPDTPSPPRTAIVHDWLTGMRGGERVLQEILKLHSGADVFTLFHFPGTVTSDIEAQVAGVSFIQKLPLLRRVYRYYLPLFPFAVEQLPLHDYDLVISISHCAALGCLTNDDATHVSYCLSPMRYLGSAASEHIAGPASRGVRRWLMEWLLHQLRLWDSVAGQRPDTLIAISHHIRKRIERRYRRDALVVHPPISDLFLEAGAGHEREDFYLMVSAMVPYKRIELAIKAFKANGKKLIIVGDGPEWEPWRRQSTQDIRFVGSLRDEEVIALYQRCKAFIFPGEEDFGLTPVEAQACGAPVIALGRGGALETVHEEYGVLFDDPTVGSLNAAIEEFEQRPVSDADALHEFAKRFGVERFRREWKAAMEQVLKASEKR